MVSRRFLGVLAAVAVSGIFGGLAYASSTTPSASDVTLTVNLTSGDAALVFNNPSAQFYAWEITSTTGGLNYANLTDIPNFGTGLHARGPTALDGVYSGFATGGYDNPSAPHRGRDHAPFVMSLTCRLLYANLLPKPYRARSWSTWRLWNYPKPRALAAWALG